MLVTKDGLTAETVLTIKIFLWDCGWENARNKVYYSSICII